ncbi:hypothetical protein EVAR_39985_1 [Eumeta japonica]|uniref:Uncharacterized protein n=1 Tax=Eumeta variegata TaxID=151549 RepID=A0A4C1YIE4_EUMVA|nr:hypothetical protein EVAR_39985_1 [Eumeta japonica]
MNTRDSRGSHQCVAGPLARNRISDEGTDWWLSINPPWEEANGWRLWADGRGMGDIWSMHAELFFPKVITVLVTKVVGDLRSASCSRF